MTRARKAAIRRLEEALEHVEHEHERACRDRMLMAMYNLRARHPISEVEIAEEMKRAGFRFGSLRAMREAHRRASSGE